MKGLSVSEPATAAIGSAIGWKALTGVALGGAGLSAIIVMLMTRPRSAREWAVGLISTVVLSIAGGAAAIMKFGLQEWLTTYTGLVAVLGLVFSCGLPAWALVRMVFTVIEKNVDGKGIAEVGGEIAGAVSKVRDAITK